MKKSKSSKSTRTSKASVDFPLVNPNAAGIDVGSRSNWACVGTKKENVQEFGVFTEDHHTLAKWLQQHKITTVAMESTGFYWKPLFLILQAYGFEVLLVNARQTKHVRGKKTDIKDCQWIRKLHQAGLLQGSFQPDEFTEELRTYNRQRRSLLQGAAQQISKMQQALVLMNLQLSVVLTDITGKSGQAIIQAILQGERDSHTLAQLADPRVHASKEKIAKALTGQWHDQYLFLLEQAWQMYEFHQQQIAKCDAKMEALLSAKVQQTEQNDLAYEPKRKKATYKNAPNVAIDKYVYQLTDGIDLMEVDGVNFNLLMTLVAEVGLDLEKHFPTAKHFTSWLGLAPNRKVTGGKVISSKTNKNKSHLAVAFRQAANAVGRQKKKPLSIFFRRVAFNHCRLKAITATARKLAVIVYNMVVNKEPYKPQSVEEYQLKVRKHKIKQIQRTIRQFDIEIKELNFE